MTGREKAYWLSKVNPYKQPYMKEAFKQGARAYWTGKQPETYLLNAHEKSAFWKGYDAASEQAESESESESE